MSNFTANFRRFMQRRRPRLPIGKISFTKEQLAIVERLERQRHAIGKVRAVIDDPSGKFEQVLIAYTTYIRHLSHRDSILISPFRRHGGITPRSYLKLYSFTRRPIGQLLLLNAHTYCPSLPLYNSRLDAILQIALPYINGENTVVIIHGNSNTPKNTRFRHWLKLSQAPGSIYHMERRSPTSIRTKLVSPLRTHFCQSSEPKPLRIQVIPNSHFLIPNSLKIAA